MEASILRILRIHNVFISTNAQGITLKKRPVSKRHRIFYRVSKLNLFVWFSGLACKGIKYTFIQAKDIQFYEHTHRLSIYLSSIYLTTFINLSLHLFNYLSTFIHLSVYPSLYLFIYLSIYPSAYPSIYIHPSISIYLPTYLSVCVHILYMFTLILHNASLFLAKI